jgi:hypothetical protein
MVSVLASCAIDCGYELRSCQTKEYKNGICCFSAKNAALRRKNIDWLARNQNNESEWSDISTIVASYQVSVHFAKQFERRRFYKISQSETRIACGDHVC